MFGPDGLRSQGARLSWLVPTSWYTEAMVSVLNSTGGTTFSFRSDESAEIHGGEPVTRPVRRLQDLLIVPRLAASVDLTATQTLLVGVSAAVGPNNSGPDASTQIYGADLYWKWKSATARAGFPFVSLQAEALFRRYGAAARVSAADPTVTLPEERLTDRGMYTQLLWGIKPRVVAGLRGDFVGGNTGAFESEQRADRIVCHRMTGIQPSSPRSGCNTTTTIARESASIIAVVAVRVHPQRARSPQILRGSPLIPCRLLSYSEWQPPR
jgi:hypothetical protein